VQETKTFSPSKEEAFDNYHCSKSEHGNHSFFECNFDAPSDWQMHETFIKYFPWKEQVSYGLENTFSSLLF
jgi:hypothetical protein